jgi:hypothetical protein
VSRLSFLPIASPYAVVISLPVALPALSHRGPDGVRAPRIVGRPQLAEQPQTVLACAPGLAHGAPGRPKAGLVPTQSSLDAINRDN